MEYEHLKHPSRFALHCVDWVDCTRCDLSQTRERVVLARGRIPCDVLFIGEAPGESENVLGRPFVGPAGKLLDNIINRAMDYDDEDSPTWTYCLTNLVACIPRDPESEGKASQPLDEHVKACSPRLKELVQIADPKVLVCVGNLAKDWLDTRYKHSVRFHKPIPKIDIIHPAAILRANVTQRGLAVQRCVVQIQAAVDEHVL